MLKLGGGNQIKNRPMLRFVSNSEMEQAEKEAAQANQPEEQYVSPLVAHIRQCWEIAKEAKRPIEMQILRDYRQRNSEYDPSVLAQIREEGGSEIFIPLTALKCSSLEAWLSDVVVPADDKAWALEPTPVVDLSPEMEAEVQMAIYQEASEQIHATIQDQGGIPPEQFELIPELLADRIEELSGEAKKLEDKQAREAVQKMERVIEDDLEEGKWTDAVSDSLYDFVTTVGGCIHGPILMTKQKLVWKKDGMGRSYPATEKVIRKEYMRVSPLDLYPSPDACSVDDGFLIHHQRPTVSTLNAMRGIPGFIDEKIDDAIRDYGAGGLKEWMWHDQERAEVEHKKRTFENAERRIDMLVFNGPVLGQILNEWGMQVNPLQEYEIQAFLIGRHLIGVRENKNPGGKRPYSVASMEKVPGSFWGNGLSHKLYDIQRMVNGSGRAVSNDMGLTSLFQVAINDIGRLADGEEIENVFPGKIWQFEGDDNATGNRPPISFFQPKSNAPMMIAVMDKYSAMADEIVPSYYNGNPNVSGAGKTASGLSMLLTQASKVVKQAVANFDRGIVTRTVEHTWLLNMLYHEDQSIKGDAQVMARGAVALLVKEQQQLRRQEFLQTTANQIDMSIIQPRGRAAVLKEVIKGLDIPIDDVMPPQEEIDQMTANPQDSTEQQVAAILQKIAGQINVPVEQLAELAAA